MSDKVCGSEDSGWQLRKHYSPQGFGAFTGVEMMWKYFSSFSKIMRALQGPRRRIRTQHACLRTSDFISAAIVGRCFHWYDILRFHALVLPPYAVLPDDATLRC